MVTIDRLEICDWSGPCSDVRMLLNKLCRTCSNKITFLFLKRNSLVRKMAKHERDSKGKGSFSIIFQHVCKRTWLWVLISCQKNSIPEKVFRFKFIFLWSNLGPLWRGNQLQTLLFLPPFPDSSAQSSACLRRHPSTDQLYPKTSSGWVMDREEKLKAAKERVRWSDV